MKCLSGIIRNIVKTQIFIFRIYIKIQRTNQGMDFTLVTVMPRQAFTVYASIVRSIWVSVIFNFAKTNPLLKILSENLKIFTDTKKEPKSQTLSWDFFLLANFRLFSLNKVNTYDVNLYQIIFYSDQ